VSLLARLVVGGIFAVSGWTKLIDVDGTIRSVRAYRLLPEAVIPALGTALPAVELALAALLLTGLLTRLAAALAIPLSAAFFFGVSSAWARGLKIDCGCFGNNGPNAHPIGGYVRELLINTLIITACAWLLARPGSRWSLDRALGLHFDDEETLEMGVTR
jgi:uncharacterized membrane protein YphA (DoxX/SURF4 family)